MIYSTTPRTTHHIDMAYAQRDTGLTDKQAIHSLHFGEWITLSDWQHRVTHTPDNDPVQKRMPFITESRPAPQEAG